MDEQDNEAKTTKNKTNNPHLTQIMRSTTSPGDAEIGSQTSEPTVTPTSSEGREGDNGTPRTRGTRRRKSHVNSASDEKRRLLAISCSQSNGPPGVIAEVGLGLEEEKHPEVGDEMTSSELTRSIARKAHDHTPTTNKLHPGCPPAIIPHRMDGEKGGRHELLSPLGVHSPGAYSTPGRAFGAPFRTFLSRYSSTSIKSMLSSNSSMPKQNDNIFNLEAELETIKATLVVDEEELEAHVSERMSNELQGRVEREVQERLAEQKRFQIVEAIEVKSVLEDDEEERGITHHSRNYYWIFLTVAVLVLAALGGTLGVVSGKTTPATTPPSMTPTHFSNTPFDSLLKLIGPSVANNLTVLRDPRTPQHDALDWLANVDGKKDEFLVDFNIQVTIERYVMALLYFSTNGKSWGDNYSFLLPSSVCEWNDGDEVGGVVCDDLLVTKLNLMESGIRGTIPSEIALLTSLEVLSFDRTFMFGFIPSEVFELSNLSRFGMKDCEITGSLPTEIGQLTSLEELDLGNNGLSGSLPASLGNLTDLQLLYLEENDFGGKLPSEIGALTELVHLSLYANNFEGSVPIEYSNLTKLESVYLESNDLTGSVETIFCGNFTNPAEELSADCSGSSPQLDCPCCTTCCDAVLLNCSEARAP